jgi:hypothetical protein
MNDGAPTGGPLLQRASPAVWGLSLLALVSLGPFMLESRPARLLRPYSSPSAAWGTKLLVAGAMLASVALCVRADRRTGRRAARLCAMMLIVSGLMAAWHLATIDVAVDPDPFESNALRPRQVWQQGIYMATLNHRRQSPAEPSEETDSAVPHCFRPLPYGFVRFVELLTHDWYFACFSYRWYFTFWFLWAYYRFVLLFHGSQRALVAVLVGIVLYPLSIQYYKGQLTDPMSHALFVLALIYLVQDRWLVFMATLALGVMAKETVVVLVPAYWACYRTRGGDAIFRTVMLAAACLAAFLLVRIPAGWQPTLKAVNNTGPMITSNLSFADAPYQLRPDKVLINYLHPVVFIVPFLLPIFWHWRGIDPRLRAAFVVIVPLLFLSNLCFGWLYESRNYMPLLPLLTTMAAPPSSLTQKAATSSRRGGEATPQTA